MNDGVFENERRARRRLFNAALAAVGLGAIATGVGFAMGLGRDGDIATGFGVLAGAGLVVTGFAAWIAWMHRPGAVGWMSEVGHTQRDKLQARRSWQLSAFPVVGLIFLALALEPMFAVLNGEGEARDYLAILLPSLYAWVSAAIALGWDGQSRKYKRYLEDELTAVLRARAITAAFVVLMAGATLSLAAALVRVEWGVVGLLVALAAAGATAGMRFAWLDREAGRDG